MSKKAFYARLILYILLGLVLPVAFMCWRFELFHKVSATKVSAWGMITIFFIAIFFMKLIKSVKKGLPYSQTVQTLSAISSVFLPLLIATIMINVMGNLTTQLFQFFVVLTICETIASIINPINIWAYQNNIDLKVKSLKDVFETILSKDKK